MVSSLRGVEMTPLETEPNPPSWPASVAVFDPEDAAESIAAKVMSAFQLNGGHTPMDHGQFSTSRFAFLFKPGTYDVEVPVGFYTQVMGLGQHPGDVRFNSTRGVYSEEGDQTDMIGALNSFWRAAENFQQQGSMLWAVSQAAGLRRIIVDGNLSLAQYVPGVGMGYSSGGFLANTKVTGQAQSGSQQQWFTRNAEVESWPQGNWNMVFVGTEGAPASHCGRGADLFPCVNVEETPAVAEKPFISINDDGKFKLQIPQVRQSRKGTDFDAGQEVDFSQVHVARDSESAADINSKLRAGLHVVLSPGIYKLEAPLEINQENQVLLGLGIATLQPTNGTAAIRVGDVSGVRVAGILLEAGEGATDSLLEWGTGAHYAGDPQNPGVLSDVYGRVGGPNDPAQGQVQARVMVQISSGHVIGDNLWLWRGDHGVAGLVKAGMNPCDHGLVVLGDNVRMYGLAVEHTLKDLVQWYGNGGETYFYQSELPYDVTQSEFGDQGFVGYRVMENVTSHKAYGVGVYHFFRDYNVTVARGIAAPAALEGSFVSPMSVYLNGHGTMQHILNDQGPSTTGPNSSVQWLCHAGDSEPMPSVGWPADAPPASPSLQGSFACALGVGTCAGEEVGGAARAPLALTGSLLLQEWPWWALPAGLFALVGWFGPRTCCRKRRQRSQSPLLFAVRD